ncbi:MAG: hypothetical protein ABIP93_04510 [Gemmatimonadaceae bacterium]
MTISQSHALEVSDGSATLYLSGTLSSADAFPLRRVCREIPAHVRTLRLDLHGVTNLDQGAMETVRAVVRYWRHSRGGGFRLSVATPHLVATVTRHDALAPVRVPVRVLPVPSVSRATPDVAPSAALTGMFL